MSKQNPRPHGAQSVATPVNLRSPGWLTLMIAVVLLGFFILTTRTGMELGAKYPPLIDAAMIIKLELGQAQLHFHDAFAHGNRKILGELREHLDAADWHTHAIAYGGSNWEHTFVPVQDPQAEALAAELQSRLFRIRREVDRLPAHIPSLEDQAHDGVVAIMDSTFAHAKLATDELEKLLQQKRRAATDHFRLEQRILTGVLIGMFAVIAILLYRHDRRRAAALRDIRALNEKIQTYINSLPHAFRVINIHDHTLRMANSASGGLPGDRTRIHCYEHLNRDPRPCAELGYECPMPTVLKTRASTVVTRKVEGPDGARFLEIHGHPVFDARGEVEAMIEYAIDITERVVSEQKRQEIQSQLDRARRLESVGVLAGGVAHDLNNMLGPVVGYPDLILLELPDNLRGSEIEEQLATIKSAAIRAADIIRDLLTLARRGRYEFTPIVFDDVVHAYLRSPRHEELVSTRPNVRVRTDLSASDITILGSDSHLFKVVMNLVTNAFDAIQEAGEIRIATSVRHRTTVDHGRIPVPPGHYVTLVVEDTGQGIDPDQIDSVFEPYFSSKEMGASGTGLGLAVVYGVLKDHQGFYDLESEVGKGTTFRLHFPVAGKPAAADNPQPEAQTGSESVLVVDDNEMQRKLAQRLLTSLGYRVDTVANGHEAVDYLSLHPVDIVILDMIMEAGFDGLDTYQALRQINPHQKAVIVGGNGISGRVSEAQALGAGAYIQKPYHMVALARAVRAELDQANAETTQKGFAYK